MQGLNFSIIIPHKPGVENDKALKLNISKILEHTKCNYELIIDTETPKDPYKIWNEASKKARGDILIFTNSDVIFSKGWDVPFLVYTQHNTIVTGYLIEPGSIGVAPVNIHKNFGKTVDEFRYNEFEQFCEEFKLKCSPVREERAWYMPCAMNRDFFLDTGGFNTTVGFPNPNDIDFWNMCVDKWGTKLLRVPSFAYHFQNLSGRG